MPAYEDKHEACIRRFRLARDAAHRWMRFSYEHSAREIAMIAELLSSNVALSTVVGLLAVLA